jgi:RimJ/RimL family protein N-acetyltransferase
MDENMNAQMMTMKTKRLFIREWNIQDAEKFFPLSHDVGVNAGPLPPFEQENQSTAEKKIIEWALTFGQTKMGILPIFLADGKTLVGLGGIKPRLLDKNAGMQFEIICQLAKEYQEKSAADLQSGLMIEALQALVQYGFRGLGLKELLFLSSTENSFARASAENAGLSFLKSVQLKNRSADIFHVTAQ